MNEFQHFAKSSVLQCIKENIEFNITSSKQIEGGLHLRVSVSFLTQKFELGHIVPYDHGGYYGSSIVEKLLREQCVLEVYKKCFSPLKL